MNTTRSGARIAGAAVCTILSSALCVLLAALLAITVDSVIASGSVDRLGVLAVMAAVAVIVRLGLGSAREAMLAPVRARTRATGLGAVFDTAAALPWLAGFVVIAADFGLIVTVALIVHIGLMLSGVRRGAAHDAVHGLMVIAVLGYGTQQVLAEQLSTGRMLAFTVAAAILLAPLRQVAADARLPKTIAALLPNGGRAEIIELTGRVELRKVGWDGPPAVRDVSLDCPAGSFVAVVGRSGSGKSTLLRLLAGGHRPTRGKIRFDGVDIAELNAGRGYVPQHPEIVAGTIADNIAMDAPAASQEDIAWAATTAGLNEEVLRLPDGYRTVLTDGGAELSGGQRQRVALARALAGRPAVLLLDDATSALDEAAEAEVHAALARAGCTRIVVAQRVSTVRRADQIVVLDRGRIAERGTHLELATANGVYRELFGLRTASAPAGTARRPRRVSPVPTEVQWSELQRDPKAVAALADQGEVRVRRRDGEALVLTRQDQRDALVGGAALTARALRSVLYLVDEPRAAAALAEEFPWLDVLAPAERARFTAEFVRTCQASAELGTWSAITALVARWKSIATQSAALEGTS
ncbi:ABC transporter family protein [Herbihabitans rhizosphaerae]|uniref:ABC transporter family protein n=1 Tax=Herbihabitans rhizosphaerae TaxID=1872711 RepID=A0A4Q7L6E0_9PSEU|nr:ATP-binding cassette domain-containing protein [Herbihabitans rhizosphaerae]RZS44874.1 ABC transporter family protein [Herbihabitans rhizosphaerae]